MLTGVPTNMFFLGIYIALFSSTLIMLGIITPWWGVGVLLGLCALPLAELLLKARYAIVRRRQETVIVRRIRDGRKAT